MAIKDYPQYKLFKFTLMLNHNKAKFQKPSTGTRAVDSTIINRAYYSAYSYVYLWLEEKFNFKPKQKWEFEERGENYISEHLQVRKSLMDHNKETSSGYLYELHGLRKKADYSLFSPITQKNINDSIEYMNNILDDLKF
ncbi:MAG: hypothetical protein IJP12_03850 [Methanobrevibacter sp.]|nr:hypothetical protein [Methanobrevibacter sp.]